MAYVLDESGEFDRRCNLDSVDLESIPENSESDLELKGLIEDYKNLTKSVRAAFILDNWNEYRPKFVKVFPVDYRNAIQGNLQHS